VSDRQGEAATPGMTGPSGPARSRAGQENVERILDVALEVFARFGYRGSRVDQIAAGAGLSKPNLLYYFRTKQELYRAVLKRTLDRWLEPLQALDGARDPADALAGYIGRKLAASRDAPAASRLFALEVIQGAPTLGPLLQTELARIVEDTSATIERWVADGRLAPVSAKHLLFTIWASTQHYADFAAQIRALGEPGLADEAFFREAERHLTRTILSGILPR
jgi:TetR/AcrR family transcriptional regulator